MQVGATVGHAEHSGDLRKFIEQGKKIIVSTVQKFPFILDEIATEGGKTFAIVIDEAHSSQGGKTSAAMSQALERHGGGRGRGDRPRRHGERGAGEAHGGAQDADQRQLLRVHRHAQEQDAGDVRRAAAARRRGQGQAPALPQLHDEAGDRGGLHPRCAQELYAGGQLLQAGQEDRGRPGVRHQEGEEEAAPVCGEPRPRDPAQGRDHGGPLPRAGAGGREDRRTGAGDGGHERHRAGHPVLPRLQGVSGGAQEPLSGNRRLLRRARLRRRQGQRSRRSTAFQAATSPRRSRTTRTAS